MKFYLGAHMPNWLERAGVPLMVSHRRLSRQRSMPRAAAPWVLDSGGFTELLTYGRWETTPGEYAAAVARYADEVGSLDWAAPQDWMCEPAVLARTGLDVPTHQRRTLENYLELRDRAPHLPIIPVLQGWAAGDYWRHTADYYAAGIDLAAEPVVGVGTVCRRQKTGEIALVLQSLTELGLALHGFGVKTAGLRVAGHLLTSADSMAWSYRGRKVSPPICGSTRHKSEANCLRFALGWRARVLAVVEAPKQLALPMRV
jgi:hypothetical protein